MNANGYNDGFENRETCYDCDHKCSKRKCVCKLERIQKTLKSNRACLKCGTSTGTITIPVDTLAGVTFTLATVNVDTKCMNHPCIQLEFASNIIATASTQILNFQIFKQCGNLMAPIPVGPIWTFAPSVEFSEGGVFTNTFSFSVCDCDTTCDECCNYRVVVTQVGVDTIGMITINTSSLAAFIVDSTCKY